MSHPYKRRRLRDHGQGDVFPHTCPKDSVGTYQPLDALFDLDLAARGDSSRHFWT